MPRTSDDAIPDQSTAPMGLANGALRFVLELAALVGIAAGGVALVSGPAGWVIGITAAAAGAAAWGTFRVDGDPGPAPVAVDGAVRLGLELVVLGTGGAGLLLAFPPAVGGGYLLGLLVHHVAAVPRLRWLLARRRTHGTGG